jgi:hypothetical protein
MGKSIYFILAGLAIVILFLNQNYDTRAFQKRGKFTDASPWGETYELVTVRKGGSAGTVTQQYVEVQLQFKTESGELVVVKKKITNDMLTSLTRKGTLPIRYLSDKPAKTRLSNDNDDDGVGGIIFGSVILGFGLIWYAIASYFDRRPLTPPKRSKTLRTRR